MYMYNMYNICSI